MVLCKQQILRKIRPFAYTFSNLIFLYFRLLNTSKVYSHFPQKLGKVEQFLGKILRLYSFDRYLSLNIFRYISICGLVAFSPRISRTFFVKVLYMPKVNIFFDHSP